MDAIDRQRKCRRKQPAMILQDGGEASGGLGSRVCWRRGEEVGGAERRQDQEERMSIVSATAPQ